MILDVVIKDVTFRDVTKKSDGKQIRIFEIEDQNGIKWTTSRQDIANEAFRRVGQLVQIQGREEQNGTYLNRYLDMVSEPGVLTPPPSEAFPIPGVVQAQMGSTAPLPAATPTPPPAPAPAPQQPTIQPSGPTEQDWQIWRQVAAKVAAPLSTSAAEFWGNLDDLVRYFAYGTKPTYVPAEPPQGQFIPEAAIQASQAEGPPPYTDDDIPF